MDEIEEAPKAYAQTVLPTPIKRTTSILKESQQIGLQHHKQTISFKDLQEHSESMSDTHKNYLQSDQLLSLDSRSTHKLPYYHQLKEIQQKAYSRYPLFPLQSHSDFINENYQSIVRKAAEQISFLLKYNPTESSIDMNESRSQMELENYQKALIKSDEMIKNLKSENEYFQRQLDTLRKLTSKETTELMTPRPPLSAAFQRSSLSQPPRFEESAIIQPTRDINSLSPIQRRNQSTVKKNFAYEGASIEQHDTNELRVIKFDLAQTQETLNVKNEQIKNLQNQLDAQRRRIQQDNFKQQAKLQSQAELLQAKIDEQSQDIQMKDSMLSELNRQLDETVQTREINLSYVIAQNKKAVKRQSSPIHDEQIKFAMQIDRELQEIMGDENQRTIRSRGNKKTRQGMRQRDNNKGRSPLKQLELNQNFQLITNQIESVRLTEQLIDDLKNCDGKSEMTILDLAKQFKVLQSDAQILIKDKVSQGELVKQLKEQNEDLKLKFGNLLDQFQDFVTFEEQQKQVNQNQNDKDQQLATLKHELEKVEQVCVDLQQEVQKREDSVRQLRIECDNLRQDQSAQHLKSVVQSLEEEIQFLKRHYEIEINLLRDQCDQKIRELGQVPNLTIDQPNLLFQTQQTNERQIMGSGLVNINSFGTGLGTQGTFNSSNLEAPLQKSQSRVKEMINSTQNAFDKLKKDLAAKEALIETRDKEVHFLKQQIQDLLKSPKLQQKTGQEGLQRRKLINDLVYMIDASRHELHKLKAIVKKSNALIESKVSTQNNMQVPILNDDQFTAEFNQQIQDFSSVISIIAEIRSLLYRENGGVKVSTMSPLFKADATADLRRSADIYLRTQNHNDLHSTLIDQINRVETLMQDNAIMQRQLYESENNLKNKLIPAANRADEIKQGLITFKLEEQLKCAQGQLDGATQRFEGFEKTLADKETELEAIRDKITKVAELFERKPINQRYSFEVLCDFITDKAKRILSKYEAVSKEKKVMQEEKNYYFQRKVDSLEAELKQSRPIMKFAEKVIETVVPRMQDILDTPVTCHDRLEQAYNVINHAENELRSAIRSVKLLKEQTNELQSQVDCYRPDAARFVKKSQDIEAKLRHAKHAEVEEVRRTRSPMGAESQSHLRMKESRSASRLQPATKGGQMRTPPTLF